LASWNSATVVDAIARVEPDREVVVCGDRNITWRQLASRARSLAWYLSTGGGLRPGSRVAIVLPNCPEFLEVFLAARKLGSIPFGVDVHADAAALHAAIDGSDAKVVVCPPDLATEVRAGVRRIPKRWRPLVVETGADYERAIATARPLDEWDVETPTADDLIAIAAHAVAAPSDERATTALFTSPLAGGEAFGELLVVLLAHGCVVFTDPPEFDARRVWDTVERERVDVLTVDGDAQARPLLATVPAGSGSPPSLRTLTSPGAPIGAEVAAGLRAVFPGISIVHVADPDVASAPPGRPMIHPRDVEARLRKHRSIVDCAVTGVSDPRVGKMVVAFVQIRDDHYVDEPELAAWSRAHLPSEMTPARFLLVDRIDRSASGDIDARALHDRAVEILLGRP
jgi:3-oxocholest-4-en-26-oate---CoA ligase